MTREFWQGTCAGIAAAAVAAHLWLAVVFSDMRAMYADFGGSIPSGTRLVLSAPWRWGIPVLGAAALAWLVVRRPRALALYLVGAVVLVVTVVVTYELAYLPVHQLAGKIEG